MKKELDVKTLKDIFKSIGYPVRSKGLGLVVKGSLHKVQMDLEKAGWKTESSNSSIFLSNSNYSDFLKLHRYDDTYTTIARSYMSEGTMSKAKNLIEKFGINESDSVYIVGMYGDSKYYFKVKNDKKLINQVKDELEQPKEVDFENMYYVLKNRDVKDIQSSKDLENMFESKKTNEAGPKKSIGDGENASDARSFLYKLSDGLMGFDNLVYEIGLKTSDRELGKLLNDLNRRHDALMEYLNKNYNWD